MTRDGMDQLPPVTRDDAREFARRTLRNLNQIRSAVESGGDAHLVTQLANSLLGLIVFPWESDVIDSVADVPLADLAQRDWPSWTVHQDDDEKEKTKTLGRLAYHIRNAIAHRRLSFSSDSPIPRQVVLHVHDCKSEGAPAYWRASINAEDLSGFCERLGQIIDNELA